ncbi:hypothetical protein Ocin01_10145 [Orchesella cincta]|uniref:Uncharacterized protein n=1 Tax=Orchesella cincta TaxID=48709 RepID=A0A1D2MV01_ORCCI|nr:hypothetical protein Ocin01_10145 [Orchesella cincta]
MAEARDPDRELGGEHPKALNQQISKALLRDVFRMLSETKNSGPEAPIQQLMRECQRRLELVMELRADAGNDQGLNAETNFSIDFMASRKDESKSV